MASNPPPSPSSDSPDQAPPFFESGASPPLIIGFVAIGAFTFGMIFLIVWRRTRTRATAYTTKTLREHALQKPRLREVWISHCGDSEGKLGWANVTPVAAKIETTSHLPPPTSNRLWKIPERIWPRRNRSNDMEERGGGCIKEDDLAALNQNGKLGLTVLLAMPYPGRAKAHEAGMDITALSYTATEYALGTLDIPWGKEHSNLRKKAEPAQVVSKAKASYVYC